MISEHDDMSELHNRIAGEIVRLIVKPTFDAGGGPADVMELCESVLVGVALACIRLGGDNTVLDVMFDRAKGRLAEIRLAELPVAGES
jgi:hypothetical protein